MIINDKRNSDSELLTAPFIGKKNKLILDVRENRTRFHLVTSRVCYPLYHLDNPFDNGSNDKVRVSPRGSSEFFYLQIEEKHRIIGE